MPTYEYECRDCSVRFERMQRFSDEPVKTCPECGGPVRRVLHPVGIVFKGSGWYVTDSRKSDTSMIAPGEKNTSDKEPASRSSSSSAAESKAGASEKKATEV